MRLNFEFVKRIFKYTRAAIPILKSVDFEGNGVSVEYYWYIIF